MFLCSTKKLPNTLYTLFSNDTEMFGITGVIRSKTCQKFISLLFYYIVL